MNAITTVQRQSLEPATLAEAMSFATMLARSSMVPRDFQGKPENVIVAIQWGREIGLGPLQALQNIAVINGRPSVWGDAMLALVRGSGLCASVKETIEGEGDQMEAFCRVARKDQEGEIIGRFSVSDAKKAGLWGKAGPWTQYSRRMLQLRARGFAIRDGFPDVLRGVISAEEAMDTPPRETFAGTTLDAKPETIIEPPPVVHTPPPADAPFLIRAEAAIGMTAGNGTKLLKLLPRIASQCPTLDDLAALRGIPAVRAFEEKAPEMIREEVMEIWRLAAERLTPAADEDVFPGDVPMEEVA